MIKKFRSCCSVPNCKEARILTVCTKSLCSWNMKDMVRVRESLFQVIPEGPINENVTFETKGSNTPLRTVW